MLHGLYSSKTKVFKLPQRRRSRAWTPHSLPGFQHIAGILNRHADPGILYHFQVVSQSHRRPSHFAGSSAALPAPPDAGHLIAPRRAKFHSGIRIGGDPIPVAEIPQQLLPERMDPFGAVFIHKHDLDKTAFVQSKVSRSIKLWNRSPNFWWGAHIIRQPQSPFGPFICQGNGQTRCICLAEGLEKILHRKLWEQRHSLKMQAPLEIT